METNKIIFKRRKILNSCGTCIGVEEITHEEFEFLKDMADSINNKLPVEIIIE